MLVKAFPGCNGAGVAECVDSITCVLDPGAGVLAALSLKEPSLLKPRRKPPMKAPLSLDKTRKSKESSGFESEETSDVAIDSWEAAGRRVS